MGSVVVHWRGGSRDAPTRDELLGYIERLAAQHERRWGGPALKRPKFLEIVTAQRSEGLPTENRVRRFAGQLTGNVLVASDVLAEADTAAAVAQAGERGVRLSPPTPANEGFLMHFEEIGVQGLDFQLFDPRQLYPAEDRVSFVFLRSEAMPLLDGRLVLVAGKEVCKLYSCAEIQAADWYLSSPSIHLRYLFENWFDLFLGWVKYFFLPDLYYWRYEELAGYDKFVASVERGGVPTGQSREELKQRVFELLLDDADSETDEWVEKMATWL